jgi:molecular chaperone GrpE
MDDEIKNQNNAGQVDEEAELGVAPTPNELEAKLAEAEKQRDEYLAGWQRTKADFINYKKEEMKHMEDVARYGNENLIKDLISVLDNFDLGLRTMEKAGPVERGIYLIRSQMDDILKKRGLEKVSVKAGDEFDPMIAEAMAEVPSDRPPGVIVEEVEPGYRLHDKILRPARVIISKGQ